MEPAFSYIFPLLTHLTQPLTHAIYTYLSLYILQCINIINIIYNAQLVRRPWSKDDPEGNICITIAENSLSADLVLERLSRTAPPPIQSLRYDNMKGNDRFRAALARFMNRGAWDGLQSPIDPDHLLLGCGCGAIIDQLFFLLCAPGDAVLIPAPYYPAFDNDLTVRDQILPHPFSLDLTSSAALRQSLEGAVASAPGPVRVLLLTTPHNPLGICYTTEQLATMARWAIEKGIHIVSDEIYAMSVWDTDEGGAPFASLLHALESPICAGLDPDLVHDHAHMIYGMSKDFCASGLRIGFLHTRNSAIHGALNNLTYFTSVGGPLQHQVAEMLEDDAWIDRYFTENNARLKESYRGLSAALDRHGIPHATSNAAMFCWIDLSSALPQGATWDDEAALWEELVYEYGVLMTPGATTHHERPGCFRICFAWVPAEALPVAAERIAACVKKRTDARSAGGAA